MYVSFLFNIVLINEIQMLFDCEQCFVRLLCLPRLACNSADGMPVYFLGFPPGLQYDGGLGFIAVLKSIKENQNPSIYFERKKSKSLAVMLFGL